MNLKELEWYKAWEGKQELLHKMDLARERIGCNDCEFKDVCYFTEEFREGCCIKRMIE